MKFISWISAVLLLWGFSFTSAADNYTSTSHSIPANGLKLDARYYRPASKKGKVPVVVMVPGSGKVDTTSDPYTLMLVRAWAEKGLGVVAYSKRGSGKSGGEISEDFELLSRDLASVVNFVRTLPDVDTRNIGLWGISQAGWVIPKLIRQDSKISFAILVSPAGVSPARQMEFYMENEFRKLGITENELKDASKLNHAFMEYYGKNRGYDEAQALLSRFHDQTWFAKVRKHPFWHEMPAEDRIYSPEELVRAKAERPQDFSWYNAPYTFADFSKDYSSIRIPLLVVYGKKDELVPIQESAAIFRKNVGSGNATFRAFEGGDHSIQISPSQLAPGYIDFMTTWILAHVKR
jgi:dipeptidyl aminopeptidase/acylaminoacyl peptidase